MAETAGRPDVAFAVPGDLATPTGGYAYARHLLDEWPRLGIRAELVQLSGAFPSPGEDDLAAATAAFSALAEDVPLLIDGLAFGAFDARLLAAIRQPIVALVHHPLALESGIAPERAAALRASETAALARAREVVVTSRLTARTLVTDYAVATDRITVAEPGTARAPRAVGSTSGSEPVNTVQVLSVGAVSPRKGYDVLVESLAGLSDLDWRLVIAGAIDRDRATVAALRAQISASGLDERITLTGAVDDSGLQRHYHSADLFVLSSRYEGYGMVLAEAMAHGLAIVATTGGAAAETVPAAAALKVPPGDVAALRDALRRAIEDGEFRCRLADGSWLAGQQLPTWAETAAKVAYAIERVRG